MQPDWPTADPVKMQTVSTLWIPVCLITASANPRSSAQLYHTAVAQSISICPIFLIRKIFSSLLSACFSHSAFSSVSPMFPCERLERWTMLLKLMTTTSWLYYPHSLSIIDTHMHACFSAPFTQLHLDLLCQSLRLKWTLNGSKRPLARFRTYHHPSLQPPHY